MNAELTFGVGVLLHPEDGILRIIDPHTGNAVPSLEEAIVWAEQEAQRAEQERQRSVRLAAQIGALGIESEISRHYSRNILL